MPLSEDAQKIAEDSGYSLSDTYDGQFSWPQSGGMRSPKYRGPGTTTLMIAAQKDTKISLIAGIDINHAAAEYILKSGRMKIEKEDQHSMYGRTQYWATAVKVDGIPSDKLQELQKILNSLLASLYEEH